jgi:hypothetical protein
VITERAQFLADLAGFAAKIDERSEKLVGYLREGRTAWPTGRSDACSTRRDSACPTWRAPSENSIRMHLDELLAQGRVTRHGEEFAAA